MENNNEHIINDELITRYLLGETDADENALVAQWAEVSDENKATLRRHKTFLDMLSLSKMDAEKEWQRFKPKLKTQPKEIKLETHKKSNTLKYWAIAASAAVLIGFVFYFVFFYAPPAKMLLAEAHQEVKEIVLSDGSGIKLNRQSTIEYPEKFDKKKRVVKLNGEAFFNVSPDTSRPFVVETEHFNVVVLGTSFYVRAFKAQAQEVVVETGKVKCVHKTTGEAVVINAGEKYTFGSKTNTPETITVNDKNQNAWKTATLVFENEKMDNIAKLISNSYGCTIVLKGEIKHCKLTVNFNNLTLEGVLNILQTILDIEIKKGANHIEIYGSGC